MHATQKEKFPDTAQPAPSEEAQKKFMLIVTAQEKGYLTPEDIMALFPEVSASVQITEEILDLGIELRPDDSPASALKALKTKKKIDITEVLDKEKMSAIDLYFKDLSGTTRLSEAEEKELTARAATADPQAMQKLVDANQRLVVSVAKDHLNKGLSMADLIQEGNIGLIRAAQKYDPKKDARFSAFAASWINRSIKQALGTVSKEHFVPGHVLEDVERVRDARFMLQKERGREPTNEEIAAYSGVSSVQVQELLRSSWLPISLDEHVGDSPSRIAETLKDTDAPPEEGVDRELLRERLEEELAVLDEEEREVLRLKYGLADSREWENDEIAVFLGKDKTEVQELVARGIEHLQEFVQGGDFNGFRS